MEATIVKLAPSDRLVSVVSFEEAFGEHSEFRGRGRARRHKKKLKKISNRGEVKHARQGIRDDQQESRQGRKDTRKTRKVARKAMGDQEDATQDENSVEQQDPETAPSQSQSPSYEAPAQSQEDEAPKPYDFENGNQEEEEEEEGFDGYSEARGGRRSHGHGHAHKHVNHGKHLGHKAAAHRKPKVEEAHIRPEESEEEMEGFDGENISGATGAQGVKNIHPPIKDVTKKIVWNKEALRRHKASRANLHANYTQLAQSRRAGDLGQHRGAIQKHDMEIQKHEDRITQLEIELASFGAHPHIPHGFKAAHMELQKRKEGASMDLGKSKIQDTIVQKGLGAQISTQRIDVPAETEMRTVELSSNATGNEAIDSVIHSTSSSTKWVIGIAALGLAYYFAKKHKVI